MKEVTRDKAFEAIKDIKHPSIDCSLVKLGIAKDIEIQDKMIVVTLALPFAGVPESVRQKMAEALAEPLSKFNREIKFKAELMSEQEKQNFLYLEHAHWKDGESPQCG